MMLKNHAGSGIKFLSLALISFLILFLSPPLFAAPHGIGVAYFGKQAGELESCG